MFGAKVLYVFFCLTDLLEANWLSARGEKGDGINFE
jgi:hypothetical protein